jgi:hypothetical protein
MGEARELIAATGEGDTAGVGSATGAGEGGAEAEDNTGEVEGPLEIMLAGVATSVFFADGSSSDELCSIVSGRSVNCCFFAAGLVWENEIDADQ